MQGFVATGFLTAALTLSYDVRSGHQLESNQRPAVFFEVTVTTPLQESDQQLRQQQKLL